MFDVKTEEQSNSVSRLLSMLYHFGIVKLDGPGAYWTVPEQWSLSGALIKRTYNGNTYKTLCAYDLNHRNKERSRE